MKKNSKYLYKLLEATAMAPTGTKTRTRTTTSTHKPEKMNFQKEVETNIESTNSVMRDRLVL